MKKWIAALILMVVASPAYSQDWRRSGTISRNASGSYSYRSLAPRPAMPKPPLAHYRGPNGHVMTNWELNLVVPRSQQREFLYRNNYRYLGEALPRGVK